jgi:hypothetical protein
MSQMVGSQIIMVHLGNISVALKYSKINYGWHCYKSITAKDFCEGVGFKSSFGTEFSMMRNLTARLKPADLDTSMI